MLFKKPSRPFDPTASSELNLVISERVALEGLDNAMFIPSVGPYYSDKLVVRNGVEILKLNVDYVPFVLHDTATLATGMPVAVCVRILRRGLSEVQIDYQAVGGVYSSVFQVATNLLRDSPGGGMNPIAWKDILEKPIEFNPASHMHHYREFTGWHGWWSGIDEIQNALTASKRSGVNKFLEEFEVRAAQFNNSLTSKVKDLTDKFTLAKTTTVEPLGILKIFADNTNPSSLGGGNWEAVNDRVLVLGDENQIGEEIPLSYDIVFPQPDNILLDEDGTPIARDDNEWMYLDNANPIYPGEDVEYGKPYDTQFDLFYVRGWVKTTNGIDRTQKLTKSTTELREGGTVDFTVRTTGYPEGTSFPYELTGIGEANVDVPLYGLITIDASGIGTLSVNLLTNGPASISTVMTLTVISVIDMTATVNYVVANSVNTSAKVYASANRSGDKLSQVVAGDIFYLVIRTSQMRGLTGKLTIAFTGGSHTAELPDNKRNSDGTYDVIIPENGDDAYVKVKTVNAGSVDPASLTVTFKHGNNVLDNFAIPAKLFAYTAVWRSAASNDYTDSVFDGEPFYLEISHNSNQAILFTLTQLSNPVATHMVNSIPTYIQGQPNNVERTALITVKRPTPTGTERIRVRVASTGISDETKEVSIDIKSNTLE